MAVGAKKKGKLSIGKGWLFLLIMILLYGLIVYLDTELAKKVAATFLNIFKKMLPILMLVFFLIFVSHIVLSPKKVKSYVGAESGLKGWVLSIVSGMLSTGPVYAWYALLGDLRKQGMKRSLVAVFLYNRAVKLPLIPLLAHYFGIGYTVILSLYLIIFSVVNGLIMETLERKGMLVDRSAD